VKLFFASFKTGMIAVPVHVRMKTPEVAYILKHSKEAIYFAHPDLLAVAEEARSAYGKLNVIHTTLETAHEGDLGALPVVNDDDPAFLLYTSGTTARPKSGNAHSSNTLRMRKADPGCCDEWLGERVGNDADSLRLRDVHGSFSQPWLKAGPAYWYLRSTLPWSSI
jgi:acyl-CoA synthetase (AMP-forming)/AMP-acid ligase II